ncbi:MAG: hypothetical protein PHT27_07475 [Candidatus Izemoplasmatales bacterium]|jgi:hypothetical protein|nr:hypothetical protein [Candidatus Izemoplasmatales bacterium]
MVFKNIKKRKKEMMSCLEKTLQLYNAKLISFEYYYKIFGNIVIEYEYKNQKHVLISDRGEIRHNDEVVYKNSITHDGHYDPFYFVIKTLEIKIK